VIGGCDLVDLAREYGTPLYLFDEATLRRRCQEFVGEFTSRYPNTLVIYACKAYINPALARILQEEGLGLDVVSAGEFMIAKAAGFPLEKVYFHGNNKTRQELELAVEVGLGRVVVDSFYELDLLQEIAAARGQQVDILLRLSPGIDPHTHAKTTTGVIDSKFGFPIATGQAEAALATALARPHLNLVGLHCHLGSPIFQVEPYQQALEMLLEFIQSVGASHGFHPRELSPGGGFAIQYIPEAPPPAVREYAEAIVSTLRSWLEDREGPQLIVEPGRAIVGRAGVALYTVGATKEVPGVRKFVSLDGGMGDNIRPALYGARYSALVANRASALGEETVTLAGKYCESGDLLVQDAHLPSLRPGDLVALPASGAYCLAMASNYNASLRPPILLLKDGGARLIRRRETFEDLLRCDVW
jgi:diaminopimelate decarboxylase